MLFDRRHLLMSLLAAGGFHLLPRIAQAQAENPGAAPASADEATPFSMDILRAMAQELAARDWQAPVIADDAVLDEIDYDRHNQVRFRNEHTLFADQDGTSPVRPFFPGRYFRLPVRLNSLKDGTAREIPFALDLFDFPEDHPAQRLSSETGFAGFRVMDPVKDRDWMAFLGASYWRTSGYSGQFGLSARGIAVDTAINGPEEFPSFTQFWLEPASNGEMTVYALLEGPSVTGAYRIHSRQADGVIQDIDATIFLRTSVERLGMAPLTSMFWYGKSNHFTAPDWRPEVHDSDGLEIHAANGERIWRPLNNPPRTMVNSFASPSVAGFGLMQRERDFEQYQDDGVFYEKRASAWIEPQGDWGQGAVSLVELRTDDEIHDNIVAFWTPAAGAEAGSRHDLSWRLSWLEDCPIAPRAARFLATRLGAGGHPGQPRPPGVVKLVCDLENRGLERLGSQDGVVADITTSAGVVSNSATYPVVGQQRWRTIFDLDISTLPESEDQPIDLRLYLRHEDTALSETLLLQLFPSQLRKLLTLTP